jgi:hypothetical protein
MEGWKKFLVGFLVLDLVVLNVAVGRMIKKKEEIEGIENRDKESLMSKDEGEEIGDLEKRMASLEERIEERSEEEKIEEMVKEATPTKEVPKNEGVFYVPIPDGDGVSSTEWIDIVGSSFVLDKAGYDGIKKIYLEGNIKVLSGNGRGRVRLWDKSNKRNVDGSEIYSNSEDWEWKESGELSIWEGKNEYVLQARSETGYRVDARGIRLKIMVEN